MDSTGLGQYLPVAIALIPAIAGIGVAAVNRQGGTPRPYRRLGLVVDMLAKSPPDSKARAALDDLVVAGASGIRSRLSSNRRVNPYTLTWVVIFLGITAVTMYWLVQWIVGSSKSGWTVLAWIVTVIVGLALTALVAAAVSTIYNPVLSAEERKAKREEKAAIRASTKGVR